MNEILNGLAYLDPGSGALVLQVIVGAVAGSLYFMRSTLSGFWLTLTGRSSATTAEPEADAEATGDADAPKTAEGSAGSD